MGFSSKVSARVTPANSEDEIDDAGTFTDGDFDDFDEEKEVVTRGDEMATAQMPLNETTNNNVVYVEPANGIGYAETNGTAKEMVHTNGICGAAKPELSRLDSGSDTNTAIVDFIGHQHPHAEQRLAARRAARAEAREIRMRELERQQREQEDHADKAYDMYTETVGVGARRLAGSTRSVLHSPRRSSDTSDTIEDSFSLKDLRHELKEVEDKFRKAMILNAQLDNDKAALSYQLELLKDRIEELQGEHTQLQREHREKCSSHERLRREHSALERELTQARDAVRARDAAIAAAGFALVEASAETAPELAGAAHGDVPPLALVSQQSYDMLQQTQGTLDVRLQQLHSSKQQLESELRKLKLQLHEEQDKGRHNGTAHYDFIDEEMETLRRNCAEYKSRAARAETEAAMLGASVARLEAQAGRLRAQEEHRDAAEEQLKQDKRRLQREAREALNRVEELETENNHLNKRLDKLKNAKSALLKEL